MKTGLTVLVCMCTLSLWGQVKLNVAGDAQISGKLDLDAPGSSVFIGSNAGRLDDGVGNYNVFVGNNAGYSNTSGYSNTFVGRTAGYRNLSGYTNTFIGRSAGYDNEDGSANTFVGYFSGYNNIGGDENTFGGYQAGYYNEDGSSNVFLGHRAGYSNESGGGNTIIGYQAGYNNEGGGNNVFLGRKAGYDNTSGSENAFMGPFSGFHTTIGARNIFIGSNSGYYNVNGLNNTFMGYFAGLRNTSGDYNTFIGNTAGYYNETGNQRTALGSNANSLGTDYDNSTGLGYDADPDGANVMRLGNIHITSIKAKFAITVDSDARFKTQVDDRQVPGLDFIRELRPVTYYYDSKLYEAWKYATYGERDTASWPTKYDSDQILQTGFLAQEVEAAAKKLNYSFSGIDKPQSDQATYGLRYATFVVPLVKAVQEQQKMIEEQGIEIKRLQQEVARINELEKIVEELRRSASFGEGQPQTIQPNQHAQLDQNIPNPTDGTIRIRYFLPENVRGKASLVFTNAQGQVVAEFPLADATGSGEVLLHLDQLPAGTYQYSLVGGQQVLLTRRMVLVK